MYIDITSKIPQLKKTYRNKSVGNISLSTVGIGWFGAIARMCTVIYESKSTIYRMKYIVGASLHCLLLFQFLYYTNY